MIPKYEVGDTVSINTKMETLNRDSAKIMQRERCLSRTGLQSGRPITGWMYRFDHSPLWISENALRIV